MARPWAPTFALVYCSLALVPSPLAGAASADLDCACGASPAPVLPDAGTACPPDILKRSSIPSNGLLVIPKLENSAPALDRAAQEAIARGGAALDRIGRCSVGARTFDSGVRAVDDALDQVWQVACRAEFIHETSPDPELRQGAAETLARLKAWLVDAEYNEEVYQAIRTFADTQPALPAAEDRLLNAILADYRRAGLHLPKDRRRQVQQWRHDLARACAQFDAQLRRAEQPVGFTRAELAGVPGAFLDEPGWQIAGGLYTVRAEVPRQFLAVMENARLEATRRRLQTARFQLAAETNLASLERILGVRRALAAELGYDSWADYQVERSLAGDASRAQAFLEHLQECLEPKFQEELDALRRLKVADTGDATAVIRIWDWRYYAKRAAAAELASAPAAASFSLRHVRMQAFRLAEIVFGLVITEMPPPDGWADDIQLLIVSDRDTREPLGAIYLDLFARPGKLDRFAHVTLVPAKRLLDGRYRRPVVAILGSLSVPAPDTPPRLSYEEVRVLLHELGHALHAVLARADLACLGRSVPRDFVEVPSQFLEYWLSDQGVFERLCVPCASGPANGDAPSLFAALQRARSFSAAIRYRRQLALGRLDLALHGNPASASATPSGPQPAPPSREATQAIEISNRLMGEVFLPVPEGTACAASFAHLASYDAEYYSYAWADMIAADLAAIFQSTPHGFANAELGRHLRDWVYGVGGAANPDEGLRMFLGRDPGKAALLRHLGVDAGIKPVDLENAPVIMP